MQISPKRITFLIVLKYMGEEAPKEFTLKDSSVVLRGLLPEIDVQASELEVCSEISSVIVNFGEEMGSLGVHVYTCCNRDWKLRM